MKKIVEVEYVSVTDLREITESALAVMDAGHYVSIRVSNFSVNEKVVTVDISLYGNIAKGNGESSYDYSYYFCLGSEKERDVKAMNDCRITLFNLLVEEE